MKTVWILSAAGPIEGENWRDYRNNQFGKFLSMNCGCKVIWWTSNFSHHFKKYRSKGWKDIQVNENFTIRLVPSSSYKKNFGIGRMVSLTTYARNALKHMKTDEKPDVLIGGCPMTMGYPIFTYGRKNGVPVIVDQMDIWPEFIEKYSGKYSKIAHFLLLPFYVRRKFNYQEAAGYIALGKNYLNFARNVAKDGLSKPHALIYNGTSIEQFIKMASQPVPEHILESVSKENDEIICVFAGTFGPSYDVDAMLECARKFHEQKLPVKFVFAGSGPRVDSVQKYANEYNNIVFLGSLKPEQLIPLYTICDIGLCAYTSKSNVDMPDKFYDYTAAGIAVINSLTEEVAEFVKTKQIGYNYNASDAEDMFSKISMLKNNPDLLLQCKKNSKDLGVFFDAKIQVAKLYDLICMVTQDE